MCKILSLLLGVLNNIVSDDDFSRDSDGDGIPDRYDIDPYNQNNDDA